MGHVSETIDKSRFALLKTERLSIAIHILTSHLSDREPLREELRRSSLRLVTDTRALTESLYGEAIDPEHLAVLVDDVISGLYVARGAKLISEANGQVLEREYLELRKYFSQDRLTRSELIDVSSLSVPSKPTSYTPSHDIDSTPAPAGDKNPKGHQLIDKKVMSVNTSTFASRKETILGIVKPGNVYSLGDVAAALPQVSEKTVQRDLLSLVEQGVLKKTGERRWSRYSRM